MEVFEMSMSMMSKEENSMKIKSLQTHFYEKNPEKKGFLTLKGTITHKELFEALRAHLEGLGMLPDEYFLSDRIPELMSEGEEYPAKALECIPEECYFTARSDFGGSEGIYLDLEMHSVDAKGKRHHEHIATGKTLKEDPAALIWMQRAATECELFLNRNGREYEVNDLPKSFASVFMYGDETAVYLHDTEDEAREEIRKTVENLEDFSVVSSEEDFRFVAGRYKGSPAYFSVAKIFN